MTRAASATSALRTATSRRSGGVRAEGAEPVQIPSLPKRVTLESLGEQITALHGCYHASQEENREAFKEVNGKIDGVAQRVSFVEGVQTGTARALGVPVRRLTPEGEPDETPTKHRTPFALLSQPKAMFFAAMASVGGLAAYQILAQVWPKIWDLLVATHHAIMSLVGL